MIDFVQLQEIARERLEQDRAIEFVEAVAPTLETAVSDAAALLDIPVRRLEYEVIEKGSSGILGMGKKDWRIKAYEKLTAAGAKRGQNLLVEEMGDELPFEETRDGQAFVFLRSGGDALLKVTPPSGEGRKVMEAYALQLLQERNVNNIDNNLAVKTIREALGVYIKVGEFEHHGYNDSVAAVNISEDEMQAFVTIQAPGQGGCDIAYDSYINTLNRSNVTHGIQEETLRNLVDQPVYGEKVTVAEGTNPVDGKDANVQYNFEREMGRTRLREGSNGRVDFKELNIIQNVVENQPLAKKIPPQEGVPGKTVTGKKLPAQNGKDIGLPVGTNVHVSDDGNTILADMNGQVVFISGLINVEPVYTVEGDVDLKTGNIIFLGNVIVNGNIEDGFSVKAAGNIEVNGNVARAELEAEGDIIIHQGVNGKGGGYIRAGKSVWARFIQNANIESGGNVIASDGIINSQVDAVSRIICQGKRAAIMGGRLRACEEINAKVLGNPTSGTETICEVGFDPKSKEELERLQLVKATAEKQYEEIKLNIQALINIKQQRKSLPDDKEEYLQELMTKRNQMMVELRKIDEGIRKIHDYLGSLQSRGKVSASSMVHPGVKIIIKDARDEVRTEYKAVTFILEDGLIRVSKYEEPAEDAKRDPDGYTTN